MPKWRNFAKSGHTGGNIGRYLSLEQKNGLNLNGWRGGKWF